MLIHDIMISPWKKGVKMNLGKETEMLELKNDWRSEGGNDFHFIHFQ